MLEATLALENQRWPGAAMADTGGNHTAILRFGCGVHRRELREEVQAILQDTSLLILRCPVALELIAQLPRVILGVEPEDTTRKK